MVSDLTQMFMYTPGNALGILRLSDFI